ncbi:MAG: hypothetical protein VR67_02225 [Peptococcaceae bacterium BRH_c8a]|nr:MAG: hypothetical protein VR67_02225 [Peptococcaceae bacterium BRH_c8a]
MKKLGYLGPPGTFSHTAAMQYAAENDFQPVCCSGLETVFRQIQAGLMDAGVVPAENSTGGTVGETLDLLSAVEGIYITGELLLPVHQHLLVRPGVKLQQIKKVYSHPQALSQCRHMLQEQLPGIPVTETASTAAAALLVSAASWPLAAAVGSVSAAENYGLEVLCSDIQDSGVNNVTRFLVLGRKKTVTSNPARTSLVLAVKDRPGALYHILREFAMRKINLTRIESRPAGNKLGDYIFFIDFLGLDDDPAVQTAITEIGEFVLWSRLLGSYPVYREPEEIESDSSALMEGEVNLSNIREKIDLVDSEIMHLLTIRQHLVDEVARFKVGKTKIVDRQREEAIVNRVRELAAENNLDPAIVEKIYRLIIRGSVLRQRELISL